ncbi:MAG: hypothetical protein APF77_15120 [Clostridia bacterium BRH_c25]|nr:MAG: hypothetical protein APF77_15120 [Clostridia bacterium BRH_c25]
MIKKVNIDFISPMAGNIVPIESVEDEIFSDKVMGDGFAIIPTDGRVVAPFDSEIKVLYPGGHAIVLAHESGVAVMIHIGLELYKLGPELFEIYVEQEQKVKKGDILVKVNLKKAMESGVSLISPIVFINNEQIKVLKNNQNIALKERDIIEIYRDE